MDIRNKKFDYPEFEFQIRYIQNSEMIADTRIAIFDIGFSNSWNTEWNIAYPEFGLRIPEIIS
jgi:hypothetical protein